MVNNALCFLIFTQWLIMHKDLLCASLCTVIICDTAFVTDVTGAVNSAVICSNTLRMCGLVRSSHATVMITKPIGEQFEAVNC